MAGTLVWCPLIGYANKTPKFGFGSTMAKKAMVQGLPSSFFNAK